MRKIGFILLLMFFSNVSISIYSQTVSSPYEIGTWKGFKPAAVSYTFDDNCAGQLSTCLPMFDNLGFKMTFFEVINWGPNWTGLQSAANNGHEVASHTVSHASLDGLDDASQTIEYQNSKNTINSNITGQSCVTIAYPGCIVGNKTLCGQYYIGARGCQSVVESSTPADMMNISSITCGTKGPVKISADFDAKVNEAVTSKGWCVFLIHAIDNDNGYSPTVSSELSTHLTYVKSNISNFWVGTFGNVVRYIKERNAASVTVTSSTATSFTIQVTDNLDNVLYNYPLSIRRPLPAEWADATVTQNGNALTSSIVTVGSAKYIMFDVVPDAGDVVITKNGTTDVKGITSASGEIKLWQDKGLLFISIPRISGSYLDISLVDMKGAILGKYKAKIDASETVSLDISKLKVSNGITIVHVSDGVSIWSKQLPIF